MGKLITTAITSLDGYTVDADGSFDWAAPDEEVHAFVNDLERQVGTYLLGRRMYEVMQYWETAHSIAGQPAVAYDYAAVWQNADKIVFSRTLDDVVTSRTRIERNLDLDLVRRLKAESDRDLGIAGPTLAAQAIKAELVDEYRQFVNPVIVGGGTSWLPDGVRVDLELVDQRRIGDGVVYLCYRPRLAER